MHSAFTPHIARALAVLGILVAMQFRAGADTDINVANYGAVANSGQDATVAFQQAIAAAAVAAKPVTLRIPAGRYDFFSTNASRRACYCSNATESGSNAIRTIGLDFRNIDQLTVEGNGSTLMMRGAMTVLVAENCHGFTLRNLTFDFAHPSVSEITAVEKGSNYWIGSVHPDSSYTITGGNRILWSGEDWSSYHNMVQPYDPVTDTTWRGGDPTTSATAIVDQGSRMLKFSVPSSTLNNVTVGRTYQFRNTTRDQVGMWLSRCKDVVMQDINVRAMRGFGILGQFTENLTYERVTVAPDPAMGRTCASAADILHYSGCKGLIRIVDSMLTSAHDDALNIHGTHLRIMETPASNQIRVRFMHAQSWGFQAFVPGDQIEFVKPSTLLPYGSAVVTSVQMLSDPREQLLTLDQAVPAGVTLNSDVVENVTWTPSVEIINCHVARIPTRGFLLTTRRPVLVQGCRFVRTQMPAILIEDDAAGWYESGSVKDLTLRSNSFYECGENVVTLNPENSTYAGAVHSNIRLDGNVFTLNGTGAVSAKSVDGLTLTNNRFRLRNNTTPAVSSMVGRSNVTNFSETGNTVEAATTAALQIGNGTFEMPDIAPAATQSGAGDWLAVNGSLAGEGLVKSDPNRTPSQATVITPGGAIYRKIGPFDPKQGNYLPWYCSLLTRQDNNAPSGPVSLSVFAWDGRFAGADGTDISGMSLVGEVQSLSTLTPSRVYRRSKGTIDLSGLLPGTMLWVRIAATGSTEAWIDDLSVAQDTAALTYSYNNWTSDNLTPTVTDPLADPDRDGLPNILEYAIDERDPLVPDSPTGFNLDPTLGARTFTFHPRNTPDVALVPQFQIGSLNPNGWQSVVDGQNGMEFVREGPLSIVSVIDPAIDRVFFRLKASFVPNPGVTIANASFESPDQTSLSPAYSTGSPTGWTFTSGVNWGVEEIRDSRFGTIGAEGSRLNSLGGAGDQVAYINIGNSGSGTATSDSVGTIAANTTYTLTVAFGQRATGDRHPDGSFGLMTGTTQLGTFRAIDSTTLTTGLHDLVYTWTSPGPQDPLIGQPLKIRMNYQYATDQGGWQQAQFDHVRLTQSS